MLLSNQITAAKLLYLEAVEDRGLDQATTELLSVVSELYGQRAQDGRWRSLKLTPFTQSRPEPVAQ